MREMLFRGKCAVIGEWVEGWLSSQHRKYTGGELLSEIQSNRFGEGRHCAGTKTIGQYTGITDCNGKKIFEGDIVAVETSNISVECDGYFEVKYDTDTARFVCSGNGLEVDFDNLYGYADTEVVGNIHDNPELMGGRG